MRRLFGLALVAITMSVRLFWRGIGEPKMPVDTTALVSAANELSLKMSAARYRAIVPILRFPERQDTP